MIKRTILLILALTLPLLAASCSNTPTIPNTEGIISTLSQNEKGRPSGKIYSSDFDKDSPCYFSDGLLVAYFGEPNIEKYKGDWLSYSAFISNGDALCEFVAIYCSTPESLTDTTRLLSSRLEILKRSSLNKNTEILRNARIITRGNYAILIVSNDPASAIKAVRKVC